MRPQSAASVAIDIASCVARRSGPRPLTSRAPIVRPRQTDRLARTSAAEPAARLMIQKKCGAMVVADVSIGQLARRVFDLASAKRCDFREKPQAPRGRLGERQAYGEDRAAPGGVINGDAAAGRRRRSPRRSRAQGRRRRGRARGPSPRARSGRRAARGSRPARRARGRER